MQRFDPSGRFETQFAGTDGDCLAACGQPTAMAVTAAGEVLVMLGADGMISRYGSDGRLEQVWGSQGSAPGEFGCAAGISYCVDGPHAMAIGRDGLLYVADTWNDRIEVFTTQGVFIRQWPTPDPDGDEHPDALAVSPNGDVLVSGVASHSVQIYSRTGDLIGQFGQNLCAGPGGDCPLHAGDGETQSPSGLAVAPNGDIYALSCTTKLFNVCDDTTADAGVERFRLGYGGPLAPGSLDANDVTGNVSRTVHSSREKRCSVRIAGIPKPIHDCSGFVRATIRWQQDVEARNTQLGSRSPFQPH